MLFCPVLGFAKIRVFHFYGGNLNLSGGLFLFADFS